MATYNWALIIDGVWRGMTVKNAAESCGYTWREVDLAMTEKMRNFLIDVSMVAGYRDNALRDEL